jgi:hypothetical protein
MVLDCQAIRHHVYREPNEQGEQDRYATDQSKADFGHVFLLLLKY